MELYRWYILKYGAYALLAVALFRLQSIPGLLEIGGVRPLPVAALAILVATMERSCPAYCSASSAGICVTCTVWRPWAFICCFSPFWGWPPG